jgi:hypothetical protein
MIVKKLGHELEEIRLRSLDNLLSKLETEILSEHHLCQNKQLFVRLFEFFNFDLNYEYKEKVLILLDRFSKNKAALRNIIDINGMSFLNSLKNDLKEDSLKRKIDEIVENLVENSSNSDLSNFLNNSEHLNQLKNQFMSAERTSSFNTCSSSDEDTLSTGRFANTKMNVNNLPSNATSSNQTSFANSNASKVILRKSFFNL